MKWFDVLWYSFMYVFVLILAIFFLRTEYGFSERREPKWFYLFIYSVYTSVVFFLFYIYTYFFFIFILSSTFLLVCFCHTGEIKLKKKPQCVCQWWSQRICYFDCRYFSILIPNAKAFVICFDLCLMLFFMYALRINNG